VAIVPIGKAQEARKQFFFEKKNQKTFGPFDASRRCGRVNQQNKSFFTLFT